MLDGKIKNNVICGSRVKIVEKKNQSTGHLTEGIVKEVLTTSDTHPYGIKVILDNGAVGRVKEIVEEKIKVVDKKKSDVISELPTLEDQYTEFKATFRFDLNKFQFTKIRSNSKEVEKSISKTVSAFMNARGGTLYIGVDDSGNVSGLDDDYKTFEKPNSDMLRLTIKSSLEGYLKNKIIFDHIEFDFPKIDCKEICRIRVHPTPDPVFVHDGGREECYVRVDNESKPYHYEEFLEYWKRRRLNK